MLKPARTFRGGYRFKNFNGQARPVIVENQIPAMVTIPLKQGFGTELKSLVKKGDVVFAGQTIARDDSVVSSPIHSSVNGVVEDVKRMNYFKRQTAMVIIRTTNASKEIPRIEGCSLDWTRLGNEKIEKLIYLSGVSSLDREGIPTRFKSSIIPPEEVKHLIVHGVGSEPYNISLELLLKDKNLLNFLEGVKILKRIMPNSKVHLSLNAQKRNIIEQVTKLTSQLEWLDTYPLEPKYPQGYDEMLVPTILNQNFPYGYSAANIGVVILNIQAVLGVYEAVCEGKPFIERIIAICGPSIKDNIHVKVRVGTPLKDILAERVKTETPVRVVLNLLSCSRDKKKVMSLLGQQNKYAFQEIRKRFIDSQTFLKTREDASSYLQRSKECLASLEESCFKQSLSFLADYMENRIIYDKG